MAAQLRIPRAPFRPGDEPDFGHVMVPRPGETQRPGSSASAEESRPLAFGMIRVLDMDGRGAGPWDPGLEAQRLRAGLRYMLLTRIFDDFMYRKQRQGKISFYVRSTGEEAVSVAQCMALEPHDMLFASYRQQGLLIARGANLVDMMCQCLSNSRDNLRGRQLPVLYSFRKSRFFTISGNLATQFPQAVGWAMAAAYKGSHDVAASWIGEGSTATADFHHALTFASVYRAPAVLNVVNNQWAISSFQGIAGGEAANFACRGHGLNIPSLRVDGNDFLAVYAASKWAIDRARANLGATLIEWVTYRAAAHSTSDDPGRYRPEGEFDAFPLGDPILRLKLHLIASGAWDETRHEQMLEELDTEVRSAARAAEKQGTLGKEPAPSPAEMFNHVFREMPPHLRRQKEESEL